MNSKKILVFADFFFPYENGITQYISNLYKDLLQNKKVKVFIITFKQKKKDKSYENIKNFHIHRISSLNLLKGNYNIPNIFNLYKILKLLKKERIDIIHTHTRFFISSLVGAIFSKINKIKHIHTEHGSMFVPHSNFLIKVIARIFDEIFGRSIMKCATFICPVSKSGINFCEKLGANDKSIFVIENGISKNFEKIKISFEKYNLSKNLNICFTGRLVKEKGVQDLLYACSNLKVDYKLFIIGEGSYRKDLEDLSKKLNLNSEFLGFKSIKFIRNFLKKIDIFVNPSYAEGFPTSVLEASISNCRVISTNVGGTKEIISNNKDGILFEPKNIKFLYKSILKLENKKTIGDLKKHILENFEWKIIRKKFYKLL